MGGRAGGGARSGGSKASGGGLQQRLLSKEAEIVKNPFETIVAFDDNGNITFTQRGTANQTGLFGKSDVQGKVVTHNHPSDASFSQSDWIAAVSGDMKVYRATTPKYTYQISRPAKGWPSARKLKDAYADAERRVSAWRSSYIKGSSDKNVAYRRVIAVKNHKINKLVAARFGLQYTKTKK